MDINKQYYNYKKNRTLPKYVEKNVSDFEVNQGNNTLIIVPFRDPENGKGFRTQQLNQFVEYYHNFGDSLSENLKILIIEQNNDIDKPKGFNRGALLNIGYELGCLSDIEPDTFIFHDVDLISDKSLIPIYYSKPEHPIHIANLWREKYNFSSFFGGIVSFNKKDYSKINGFPNTRFLWGGEDDIMLNRIVINKMKIIKPKDSSLENKGLIYDMGPETSANLTKKENEGKKLDILKDLKNWKSNGLNSLKYEILDFDNFKYENVFRIKVKL